ncbi:hypothetical protein PSKAS_06270 [Peribacillus sp. N1]
MNEEQLDRLYQHIAEVVVETIPEEWSKFYLYGEVVEGAQKLIFIITLKVVINRYTAMS